MPKLSEPTLQLRDIKLQVVLAKYIAGEFKTQKQCADELGVTESTFRKMVLSSGAEVQEAMQQEYASLLAKTMRGATLAIDEMVRNLQDNRVEPVLLPTYLKTFADLLPKFKSVLPDTANVSSAAKHLESSPMRLSGPDLRTEENLVVGEDILEGAIRQSAEEIPSE